MRSWKNYGIFAALCLTTAQLWAGDPSLTAHEWLQKMSRAAHELDYEGTFVYLRDKHMVAMQITHVVDERGEHERLISLSGPGHEVVLSNNSMTSLLPGQSVPSANGKPRKSFPEALSEGVGQLENYYNFTLLGKQRVAGRLTQRINVKPKDSYRYGYRLWLDDSNGLLLKADMVNEQGVPVEQVMFTEISLNDVSAAEVVGSIAKHTKQEDSGSSVEKAEIALSGKQEFAPEDSQPDRKRVSDEWRITELPEGFRLAERNKYIMPESRMPVEHLVLTDGLASVSVFIEKSDPQDKFTGTSHRGAVNVYGMISHGHQITLVGEVPVAAVQLIGQSIKHQSEP